MNKYGFLISFLVFKIIPSIAAPQATISLVANTATSIAVPADRHAYVQYKVTNHTAITRTLTMVPIPNVSQVERDTSQCANPFTLKQNESCNLTLYVEGGLQNSNYSGGPVICKTKKGTNSPDPFFCSQPEQSMRLFIYSIPAFTSTVNRLYVSNWSGGSISLCDIDDRGRLAHCLVSAVSDTFVNPEALAINESTLFVANIGGGMSSCTINTINGELTDCKNAITDASNSQIHAPDGIAINNGKAYISNSGPNSSFQGVTTCTVTGASLGSCVFTKGNATFSVPSDLAFFNNTGYITNFNNQDALTTYCAVDDPLCQPLAAYGTITGTGDLLNEPEGLFITTISGSNYAYFTNHGNHTITLCKILQADTFGDCANTEGYFTGFGNLTILSNPLKAFIPSGLKTISTCEVNSNNGTLSDCVDSTETSFNNPSGMVIMSVVG